MLSSIINDVRSDHHLLLVQSSAAQSCLPIFRQICEQPDVVRSPCHFLLFCLLHPSSALLTVASCQSLEIHDWTTAVPGYQATKSDLRTRILSVVNSAPPGPIQIAFDSIDTLLSDIGSVSETYRLLRILFGIIKLRQLEGPSRLILHASSPSDLVPLLIQPSFSLSMAWVVAHPPAILTHIAKEYLTPPPPVSPPAKFWRAFLPLSERAHDVNYLIHGPDGEGSGSPNEMVVELLVRSTDGFNGKRGIERVLEGWRLAQGPCGLSNLESLRPIFTKSSRESQPAPDPTPHASFNLNLTAAQQESRAQVTLPYLHHGRASPGIFYDPDSADDLDDDDPDEDLDV